MTITKYYQESARPKFLCCKVHERVATLYIAKSIEILKNIYSIVSFSITLKLY